MIVAGRVQKIPQASKILSLTVQQKVSERKPMSKRDTLKAAENSIISLAANLGLKRVQITLLYSSIKCQVIKTFREKWCCSYSLHMEPTKSNASLAESSCLDTSIGALPRLASFLSHSRVQSVWSMVHWTIEKHHKGFCFLVKWCSYNDVLQNMQNMKITKDYNI